MSWYWEDNPITAKVRAGYKLVTGHPKDAFDAEVRGETFGGMKNASKYFDPSRGYDTAADAAKQAQDQYRQLAELQWQRQMQGLQQALAQMQGSQQLAARFAGAGRPAGPPVNRVVTAPKDMDPSAYLAAQMRMGGR